MTANAGALDLLAGLVMDDGSLWGETALDWQWDLAHWALDPDSPPNRCETRPRGGSKSTDTAGICMAAMLTYLRPGSRLHVVAINQAQARLIVDFAGGIISRTPALRNALTPNAFMISTRSGSTLDVLTADGPGLLGLKSDFMVADEFFNWPNTANAKYVWTSVASGMGKVKGAKLLCMSTSGDPGSWTHKTYALAQKSKRWSTQDVPGPLPWVSEDFLDDQRAQWPDSVYRRLFLNEWCAPEDRLTNIDDIQACVTLEGPLDPVPGQHYVIGVDLSMVKDRTACAVMHAERVINEEGRNVVQRIVLDRLEVWKPSKRSPIDFDAVEAWILFAAKQYRARVYADIYQAAGMAQRIRNQGVTMEVISLSQQSNNRMAVALHTTIRSHRLAIPNDPELIDELVNMRLVETAPNQFKLDHDPDKHNDRGTALGLAVLTLTTAPPSRAGMIFCTDEEWEIVKLEQARSLGYVPQPVNLMAAFGAPDWSTGMDREDDDDQSQNGQTMPSPYT